MKAITIEQLEKRFQSSIPRNIKQQIKTWIDSELAQKCIDRALNYSLSDNDVSEIYKLGKQKGGQMPYLYWLCCIYIHPFTPMQALGKKVEKLYNRL